MKGLPGLRPERARRDEVEVGEEPQLRPLRRRGPPPPRARAPPRAARGRGASRRRRRPSRGRARRAPRPRGPFRKRSREPFAARSDSSSRRLSDEEPQPGRGEVLRQVVVVEDEDRDDSVVPAESRVEREVVVEAEVPAGTRRWPGPCGPSTPATPRGTSPRAPGTRRRRRGSGASASWRRSRTCGRPPPAAPRFAARRTR